MTTDLPTLAEAKMSAKTLRADLAAKGVHLGHSQALERIAQRHGFRDWNSLSAAIRDLAETSWRAGQRVTGSYLSQRFAATVLSAQERAPGWVRLELDLDDAVDVVRFEGFSNLRKRIRGEVGPDGRSRERTSDGVPHLQLDPSRPSRAVARSRARR